MKQKTLFIAALVALLALFAGAALFYAVQQDKAADQHAAANSAALVRMHAPTLGPAGAPVTIVEFLDPACETCAAFYPLVKQLMAAHPDKVRLVLRYAPFHSNSDKVVAVLEAARRQGRFWPALEALLATQSDWSPHHTPQPARVWKHLEGVGLDMERMAFDITAPEIAQLIAQDLADAQTLGVAKTPTFFVNGRPLPSFGYEQLRRLVDEAVRATG
jgi:protein-disulfide isomerase